MNDYSPILKNVKRFIELTEEEEAIFISHLRMTKAKKKQFIVQPDFICNARTYIVKGALRGYLLDEDDQKHTISLAIDDWWISDFTSYILQEPATLFVEALEDSTLIQLTYKNEQQLYKQVPKFERFFRISSERGGAAIQRRMLSTISKTAGQRFDEFEKKYPHFLQRFPQYIIASFLGMTTQFYSRIRKQKGRS